MKKTIGIIILLIITLIALTGCVNINYEVKVNTDGSGDISYIYAVSKETLKSLQTTSQDFVSSMKAQAEKNNYETEFYEDDEMEGFKANKHINNLTKDFSLQEAFGDGYVKDTEENGIKINKNFFRTKISQKAQIDLSTMKDLESMVDMKYTIKLPARASNNATETSDGNKTLTWNLKVGEVNNIEFSASKINVAPIIIIVILIVVIIAAIVFLVLFLKKKKLARENVTKE